LRGNSYQPPTSIERLFACNKSVPRISYQGFNGTLFAWRQMYQCGSCSIQINDAKAGTIIVIPLLCGRVCGENACPRCVKKRQRRLLGEIEAERNNGSGQLRWVLVSGNDTNNISSSLKRWITRYRKLPLDEGAIFLFEDDHGLRRHTEPLPEDKDKLKEWIAHASQTPKGKRMSGTRTRRDKPSGEIPVAGWGYPKPKPEPTEGKTVHKIALGSVMLKDYYETKGATIDSWHGQVNEFGSTKYKASAEVQEAIMEALEMNSLVLHPDNDGPIFDISGDALWTPGGEI